MTNLLQQSGGGALVDTGAVWTAAEYRHALDRAEGRLRTLRPILRRVGVPTTEQQRSEAAQLMVPVIRRARTQTHQAAVNYLRPQTLMRLPDRPPAYEPQAVVSMLERVAGTTQVGGEPVTERPSDVLAVETTVKRVERAVKRHVEQPARDLVVAVADATEGVAWARVLTGRTSCSFCAMLASRGPVYSSERAALQRGGASVRAYHDGCDCIAQLVTDYDTWEGRDAHRDLEDLWLDATQRTSGTRSLNAFRREWEQKVRRGETDKYLAQSGGKDQPAPRASTPEPPKVQPASDPLPDMLKKSGHIDRAADLALVNPRFKDSKQWQINCTRCTTAVELRARGYDVTATPKPARIQDHGNRSVLNRWLSPDGKTPAGMNADINGSVNRTNLVMGRRTPLGMHQEVTFGPSSKTRPETSSRVWDWLPGGAGQNGGAKTAADDAVASWGEGARGFITVTWRRGNSGHIFNVENRGGKAVYIDGQSNEIDASGHWDHISSEAGAARIVRVDDLTPRAGGPNELGVTEWVAERTGNYLKAEAVRVRKQAEKKAAAAVKPKVTDLMKGAAENGIDLGARGYARYKAFTDGAKDAETKPTVDAESYSDRSDLQDAYLAGFFWYRRWREGR